jgi:hypothetical protein
MPNPVMDAIVAANRATTARPISKSIASAIVHDSRSRGVYMKDLSTSPSDARA